MAPHANGSTGVVRGMFWLHIFGKTADFKVSDSPVEGKYFFYHRCLVFSAFSFFQIQHTFLGFYLETKPLFFMWIYVCVTVYWFFLMVWTVLYSTQCLRICVLPLSFLLPEQNKHEKICCEYVININIKIRMRKQIPLVIRSDVFIWL